MVPRHRWRRVLGFKVNKGHGFGYWLILIFVLVGTGLAVRRFTDTGGKLPSRGARP